MRKPRYYPTDVIPNAVCPVEPEPLGLGAWRYPWKHMEPGHWFVIDDRSEAARTRLSSAAAAAAKRLGVRFSTGPYFVNFWDQQNSGWWCIRHDGCEIGLPSGDTQTQRRGEDANQARIEKRKLAARGRFRPTKRQLIEPLGTYAPETASPLEEGDYTGWDKPSAPEEYL